MLAVTATRTVLTSQGNKPPVIQGRIEVVDLNMGTQVGYSRVLVNS